MMNILQLQDQLKGLSQEQLVREMQMPSGSAPQYLVLSEITRRKKMQDALTAEQQRGPQATVAQEAIAAAGVPQAGLGQMAQAMAPRTDAVQNTGIAQVLPPEMPVQGMADGGYVRKMAPGGEIIVRNGRQYEVLPDGTFIDVATGQRTLLPSNTMVPQAAYDGSISLAAPSAAAAREYFDNQMARPGDYQAEANLARLAAARQAPRSPYETITQFDVDATGPGSGPIPDDGRTWGQRNIGDPIRDFFQPFRENAPQFVLGPAPEEPPPVLARQAQFEPVGLSSPSAMDAARQAAAMLGAEPAAMTPYEAITRFDIEPGAGRVGLATGQLPVLSEVEKQRLAGNEAFTLPELLRDKLGVTFDLSGAGSGLPGARGFPVVGGGSPEEEAAAAAASGATANQDTGTPLTAAEGVAAAEEARKINEELAASDEPTGPAGPSGGTGAGGAAATGASSYEQELIDALARADKRATQDKWLALAQAGLAIMDAASRQGTFAGAVGEGGAKGLAAFRQGRDEAESTRLALLKDLEAARFARMQLAMRGSGGGGGGGLTPYQMYQIAKDEQAAANDEFKAFGEYVSELPEGHPLKVEYALLAQERFGGGAGNFTLSSAAPK